MVVDKKQRRTDMAWLRLATVFSMTLSKDPECQVGACVVTPDNMRSSLGYNGFPRGVDDSIENWENKPLKNSLVIHAEANALIKAPFDTAGSTLYVTREPCHSCLGLAVNAGCIRVVWLQLGAQWKYINNEAFCMIVEASGIQLDEYMLGAFETALLRLRDIRGTD
jgi:dCMP deaminase